MGYHLLPGSDVTSQFAEFSLQPASESARTTLTVTITVHIVQLQSAGYGVQCHIHDKFLDWESAGFIVVYLYLEIQLLQSHVHYIQYSIIFVCNFRIKLPSFLPFQPNAQSTLSTKSLRGEKEETTSHLSPG